MRIAGICVRMVLLVAMSAVLFVLSVAGVFATCLSVVFSVVFLRKGIFAFLKPEYNE